MTESVELQAEIKRLRAEVERLNRYYKNGIECFAKPCEKHSGEKTPPVDEFFEKYGGQCLICVVDNNKALQTEIEALLDERDALAAENARLREALKDALAALEGMEKWASSIFDGYPPSTASMAASPYREAARVAINSIAKRKSLLPN